MRTAFLLLALGGAALGCHIEDSGLGGGRGDAALRDGGGEAGPVDAGPPTDACGAGSCDDGIPCTLDTCASGGCAHLPRDSECVAAPGGSCDPTDGCQYPTCTPEICAPTDGCSTATCEGDLCVRESRCGPDRVCCAGACVAPGCDDLNACTDDACDPALGCQNVPNTRPCDDGLFCNGAETCGGGACLGAGSPCPPTASLCDEDGDRCVGCILDSDCPDPVVTPYGECLYADACAESGQRTRSITTYTCLANSCAPSVSTEVDACTRDTDGVDCGGACGDWSGCDWESSCDDRATRRRTCTPRRCAGGTCTSGSPLEQLETCSRWTTGFPCALDGRPCTADECRGGVCAHPCRFGCSCGSDGSCGGGFGCS